MRIVSSFQVGFVDSNGKILLPLLNGDGFRHNRKVPLPTLEDSDDDADDSYQTIKVGVYAKIPEKHFQKIYKMVVL